ncbi:hypothetical protein CHS0354_034907 [Potamilus streckersoni]|uniref:Glycine-rich protein n=1 Tax=Potamilus streckersoni TaxID=2493646 RepID=A0AAE0SD84_9BIVA|nr:hypothetical protein CHS0354_034907 [Potamilus streckersoni]
MKSIAIISIGVFMMLGLSLADYGYGGGYGGFYPSHGGGYSGGGSGGFGLLLPLLLILILFPMLFNKEPSITVNVINATSG